MHVNSPGMRYMRRLSCWGRILKAGKCSMHLKTNRKKYLLWRQQYRDYGWQSLEMVVLRTD